ncbi:MAG: Menaquinone reductase, iron-sulfur cluster-binding subunit [bacterium]|nr:Menaquinone reductase, iron-sulfur cluster-binding subunit [bacterium]MCK6560208.1 4Fe-4S dicluster domain-containing protein [bacterium]NUM66538.1 4Fe-4S dicluster domain-containing protein [candidate division KSB1 bacterium]
MDRTETSKLRYGMVIDLDRCDGCGACMVACAVENNVPPAQPRTNDRTGLTWLRVFKVENGADYPASRSVFVPMPCQQCELETPCVSVCPQNAVEVDQATGIVTQVPVRCLGCRYCMTACPYHARYFNWWDPEWPAGMEKTLNPDVAPRMRGVVEKCNFCHGRLQAARAQAAAEGRREPREDEYVPACVEACPRGAIVFGDLADPNSKVAQLAQQPDTFQFLVRLGTAPKVHYHSRQPWVQRMVEAGLTRTKKESANG